MISRWQRKEAVKTASAESPKKSIEIISLILLYAKLACLLSLLGMIVKEKSN